MPARRMGLAPCIVVAWIALSGAATRAQPALEALWPNSDGRSWLFELSYEDEYGLAFTSPATLRFNGTVLHHGHELQVLEGSHDVPPGAFAESPHLPPLARAVWQARPDLRDAIEERYARARGSGDWWMSLLHGGFFQENPTSFQMWQPGWNHPTWTYLQTPLTVGATFSHQLLPELADDLFLLGTVESIDADVATLAGTFSDAVKMSYLIDFGTSTATDDSGVLIGTFHSETRGHVHYAPGAGPVELLEEFFPYVSVDCGSSDCPQDWLDLLGIAAVHSSLSLTQNPTAIEGSSWGATKAAYR